MKPFPETLTLAATQTALGGRVELTIAFRGAVLTRAALAMIHPDLSTDDEVETVLKALGHAFAEEFDRQVRKACEGLDFGGGA